MLQRPMSRITEEKWLVTCMMSVQHRPTIIVFMQIKCIQNASLCFQGVNTEDVPENTDFNPLIKYHQTNWV